MKRSQENGMRKRVSAREEGKRIRRGLASCRDDTHILARGIIARDAQILNFTP